MGTQAKKISREAVEETPELSMTPMIDIIFQLLIFFMLACRFRTQEGELRAALPKDKGLRYKTPEPITLRQMRIKLLWYGENTNRPSNNPKKGRVVLKVDQRVFPSARNESGELAPDWNALYKLICQMRENYTPSKYHPTLPAIIDARKQVQFKHVVSVLNECVRAGLREIEFAAPEIPY